MINRRQFNAALALSPLVPSLLCAKEKPVKKLKVPEHFDVLPQHAHLFQFQGKNWCLRSHKSELEVYLYEDAKPPVPHIDIFDNTFEMKHSYNINRNGFKDMNGTQPIFNVDGVTQLGFKDHEPIWEMDIIESIPNKIRELSVEGEVLMIYGLDDVYRPADVRAALEKTC